MGDSELDQQVRLIWDNFFSRERSLDNQCANKLAETREPFMTRVMQVRAEAAKAEAAIWNEYNQITQPVIDRYDLDMAVLVSDREAKLLALAAR